MTIKVGDTVQFVNDGNPMLSEQPWIVGSIEVEDNLVIIKSDDKNNLCSIPLFDSDSTDKYLKKINLADGNKKNPFPFSAHSFEVFSIKENENGRQAFIGYKLNNDDFHFIQVPFTEPKPKRNKDLFGEDVPNVYFVSATSKDDAGWMQMICGKSSIDNHNYVVTTNNLKADEIPVECCDAKSFSELVAKLLNQYYNRKQ